ncbi:MAG TPA: alpha-L-fucosidase [Chloroflexota bacterium]|nr:alpha-L-fucosidase [Chloroflexota bacterium]
MRCAVLTTKHHDGFALYDTELSDYSAPRRAAGRDLVRPYDEAFRAAGLRVGFYFSLCDWYHLDYPVEVVDSRPGRTRPARVVPPGAPESIAASSERWGIEADLVEVQRLREMHQRPYCRFGLCLPRLAPGRPDLSPRPQNSGCAMFILSRQ